MRKCIRIFSVVCFFAVSAIMMLLMVGYIRIPDEMSVTEYDRMNVGKTYVCQALTGISAKSPDAIEDEYVTSIKLFNIFPIKKAKVTVTQRKYVVPGGNVFGIRLYTRGVMVIRIDEVTTPSGNVSPGRNAGLKEGDMIISVNGVSITRNKELSAIFSSSKGESLKMQIERGGQLKEIVFTPVLADDSSYKGGLWIRDSTAGIGTISWYDRNNGIFAGLGHAVCDVDTGEVMPLAGGDAVEATVNGCYKGSSGSAGELCGVFSTGIIGDLYINGNTGIYGVMKEYDKSADTVPVALKREVKEGAAQIICTVDESGPKFYDVMITKVFSSDTRNQRNLTLKVTDKSLIEKTGGIVQGMSGSPIIQNGMLVGAVTHVFLDDCTEGYGILAEDMLETAADINPESYSKAS
ncbi:MAG: SpoIVB peptidase [Clostridia bacterium]|nr:SpoIVB peptidase [Clostridia bacterium]